MILMRIDVQSAHDLPFYAVALDTEDMMRNLPRRSTVIHRCIYGSTNTGNALISIMTMCSYGLNDSDADQAIRVLTIYHFTLSLAMLKTRCNQK